MSLGWWAGGLPEQNAEVNRSCSVGLGPKLRLSITRDAATVTNKQLEGPWGFRGMLRCNFARRRRCIVAR